MKAASVPGVVAGTKCGMNRMNPQYWLERAWTRRLPPRRGGA